MSDLLGGTWAHNFTDIELVPSVGLKSIALKYRSVSWNYLFPKQFAY